MYITGTISSFSSRLHQLPPIGNNTTETADFYASGILSVNQFITEGKSYIDAGLVTAGLSGMWEKEARQNRYMMSGDAQALVTQMF